MHMVYTCLRDLSCYTLMQCWPWSWYLHLLSTWSSASVVTLTTPWWRASISISSVGTVQPSPRTISRIRSASLSCPGRVDVLGTVDIWKKLLYLHPKFSLLVISFIWYGNFPPLLKFEPDITHSHQCSFFRWCCGMSSNWVIMESQFWIIIWLLTIISWRCQLWLAMIS